MILDFVLMTAVLGGADDREPANPIPTVSPLAIDDADSSASRQDPAERPIGSSLNLLTLPLAPKNLRHDASPPRAAKRTWTPPQRTSKSTPIDVSHPTAQSDRAQTSGRESDAPTKTPATNRNQPVKMQTIVLKRPRLRKTIQVAQTSVPQPSAEKPEPEVAKPAPVAPKEPVKEPAKESMTDSKAATPAEYSTDVVEHYSLFGCRTVYEPWELASWHASTRTLFLTRTDATVMSLALDSGTGATLVSTSDLDLPVKYGQEVTIRHLLDSASGVELSYFWLGDATDSVQRTAAPTMNIAGTSLADLQGVTSFNAQIRSKLWNAEANIVHRFRDGTDHPLRLSMLIGPRFIGFDESFGFQTVSPTASSSLFARAENTLFGGQFGVRGVYQTRWPNLDIHFAAKLGFFADEVAMNRTLTTTNTTQFSNRDGVSSFAQLIDGAVEVTYKLRPGLHLSAGYNMMFLTQIARATDQIIGTLSANPVGFQSNDDVFLHGLRFGIKLYWGQRTDPTCEAGRCTPYIVRTDCR